jgi:hypothetical protein
MTAVHTEKPISAQQATGIPSFLQFFSFRPAGQKRMNESAHSAAVRNSSFFNYKIICLHNGSFCISRCLIAFRTELITAPSNSSSARIKINAEYIVGE